jgi:hypothetical protein
MTRTCKAIPLTIKTAAAYIVGLIKNHNMAFTGGYGVDCNMGVESWGDIYQGNGKHVEINYQRKAGNVVVTAFETTVTP